MDLPFLPIALSTTGAAALINLWLQLRIIAIRVSHKIEVGDGGDDYTARPSASGGFECPRTVHCAPSH